MNLNDLYDALHQVGFKNPEYRPAASHSTFLIFELAEDANSIHFASTIIDPGMPEKGGSEDYLHLQSMQRTALELSNIAHIVIDDVSGVAIHGPKDLDLRDGLKNRGLCNDNILVKALRFFSLKAAARALELATRSPEGHA